MTKRYINPPIIEALCEFQFDQASPWDLTLIGQVYDELKETFPKKQQLQITFAAATTSEVSEQIGTIPMIPLMRFLDNDGRVLVQLGQNLLTVNHLRPYTSWEDFFPLIEKVFNTYCEIAQPKSLQHIGVRYINRIDIPKSRINLEDYFKFRPLIPEDLPQDIGTFLIGVRLPSESSRDTLHIQLATANPEVIDALSLILEISYIFSNPGEVTLGSVLQRVDVAHKHVESAFESCLKEELKQLFGEVKE